MRATVLIWLLVIGACSGGSESRPAESAAPPPAAEAPAAPAAEAPPSVAAVAKALEPWSGDLDQITARRYVRLLVTFSRTNYVIDGAEQHGLTYEAGRIFEEFLNKRLGSPAIRIHVAFIPVSRDRIFQALAEGRGDIAAANLTITPEREKLVDFGTPLLNDVREVVVTAADQAPVSRVEDLAGREVHVRRSSSYYESLVALNATLDRAGLAPVRIVESSEQLEDEDLLELVNAGVIPATIVDNHVADIWSKVFDAIRVRSGAAVRDGGRIAWAVRRSAPKLR
jgi:membrane-bound lytic murein transglycosylase MltF